MYQVGLICQYLGLQQFSRKSEKVNFLPYHVTWGYDSMKLKIAIFKTCPESLNMGRVCSVLMPVVTLQSFKVIGRLEVG